MNPLPYFLVVLALLPDGGGDVRPADAHRHPPVAAAPQSSAQRWPADAPLRAGMARVRAATAMLAPLPDRVANPATVRAQADEIQAAVNAIFAQCRLPPEPDAALHPLLARLLVASQALKTAPTEAAPIADLQAVLALYPQRFIDPEWPQLEP